MMKIFISFVTLVIAVIVFYFLNSHDTLQPLTEVPNKVYDYVIVGAGSAGSVIASRLSENRNVTVLLVEAGSDDRGDYRVSTPAYFGMLLDNAWSQYVHTRDTNSATAARGQIPLRAGMIMGGGSSVNVQIYARGSRHDFDQWAKLTNDETWDYDHVLTYFKKSEGVLDENLKASSYHGRNGPLSVSTHKNGWGIYKEIVEAFKELGFPYNKDYNGKTMKGIAYTQYNRAYGERVSCSKAFIHPALERPNLHVTTNSYAQRILIRERQVYGIEMVKSNRKYSIAASKEVILSAGSIQSPKILMLSGIGPKDILTKHGIPVVKDLPVGRNLQNHPIVDVPISVTNPVTGVLDPFSHQLSYVWYKLFKEGWLATSDADALLFTSMTQGAKEKGWPDMQLMFIGKPFGTALMKGFNFKESIISELAKERDLSRYGFVCFPSLMRPKSNGYVSIISNDPYDLPFVKTDFLDNEDDLDLLVRGIRICQSIVNTTAMRSVGASVTDTVPLSLCKEYDFGSDDYWKCYIKTTPLLHFHPSGTCKMGSNDDPTAVLDSKLRVKGITGLRVVDASVMPEIVAANTHAATVMIAEKAADMIRGKC